MTGEFDGKINLPREKDSEEMNYKKLPEQKPTTDEEWANQSNKRLKKISSPYKVINSKNYLITRIILIIIAMIGMAYFILNDYFSPTLNTSCNPNLTCEATIIPQCPSCNLTCGNYNITFNPVINLGNWTNHS
jgi:hypothetical protein